MTAGAFAVGREDVRRFAAAVGEPSPLHHDVGAARAAGFADVVAPPMFAVVYTGRALLPARLALGPVRRRRVELEWGPLVVAGDELETAVLQLGAARFATTTTRLGDGAVVCRGTWTWAAAA